MAVIKVPKTPKRAFNKERPASELLKSQIVHLEWATRPAAERKPGKLRIKPVRTEGEAAARIERLTRKLLQEGPTAAPAGNEPGRPKARRAAKPGAKRNAARRPKNRRRTRG